MAAVLDFDTLRSVTVRGGPGGWAHVARSFRSPSDADALTRQFPTTGFGWSLQRRLAEIAGRGDGRFRTSSRPLLRSLDPALAGYLRDDDRVPSPDAGTSAVVERESLAPVWNAFAEQLLSFDYRSAIGWIAGLDLSRAPLQADLEVGEPGSWYHAHRDLGRRAVSHIFYFNPEWDARWGGCLRILRTRDIESVVAEIVPLSNASVVLVHRGALWHGTLPLAPAAAARRSLHVWFWA